MPAQYPSTLGYPQPLRTNTQREHQVELPFRCMSQAGVLAGAPTGQHQASAPAALPPGVTEPSAPPVQLADNGKQNFIFAIN